MTLQPDSEERQPMLPVSEPESATANARNEAALPSKKMTRTKKLLLIAGVGIILWLSPHPEEISSKGWHLLVIFAATIAAIILQPLPTGAVAALAAAATMLTGTLSFAATFKAFSMEVPWLIAIAMFLSESITKCGLGQRLAYSAVSILGARPLGLAFALVATDALLSPAIPSVAARSGGIILPLARSLSHAAGSRADDGTAKRLGAFLMVTCFQSAAVSSAMFLTANHPNPLSANLAESTTGLALSWGLWAKAALAPGIVNLLVVPVVTYVLYPPSITASSEAQLVARHELAAMGSISREERIVTGAMLLTVVLWVFGQALGVSSVAAALAGLSVMLLTDVLTWKQCLGKSGAWDTMWWFAIVIALASELKELGVIGYFAEHVSNAVSDLGWGWKASSVVLLLVYFYSHYLFASNVAHVSAMYTAFLACMISVGAPPVLASLVLACLSNMMGGLGTWTMSHAPMYYSEGFVAQKDWLRLGAILSVINITIWLSVGMLWWRFLGMW